MSTNTYRINITCPRCRFRGDVEESFPCSCCDIAAEMEMLKAQAENYRLKALSVQLVLQELWWCLEHKANNAGDNWEKLKSSKFNSEQRIADRAMHIMHELGNVSFFIGHRVQEVLKLDFTEPMEADQSPPDSVPPLPRC